MDTTPTCISYHHAHDHVQPSSERDQPSLGAACLALSDLAGAISLLSARDDINSRAVRLLRQHADAIADPLNQLALAARPRRCWRPT
jgi:hypothetical protein